VLNPSKGIVVTAMLGSRQRSCLTIIEA